MKSTTSNCKLLSSHPSESAILHPSESAILHPSESANLRPSESINPTVSTQDMESLLKTTITILAVLVAVLFCGIFIAVVLIAVCQRRAKVLQRKRYVIVWLSLFFNLHYNPGTGMSLLHMNTSTLSSVRISTFRNSSKILPMLFLLQGRNFCD